MKLFVFALLVGLCSTEKIIGGTQVGKTGDIPYIVHLDMYGSQFCDGSIYNNNWILSAAHCYIKKEDQVTVVAGDLNLKDNSGSEQEQAVAEMIQHPGYDSKTMLNDIMLIRLYSPLILNDVVKVVALYTEPPESTIPVGTDIIVSGWGNLNSGGITNYPDDLYEVTVQVISTVVCNTAYGGEILDGMICIGVMEGGKDSCQGDSGGPAVDKLTNTLVGIVSWGYGCAQPNQPGVYTYVPYFSGWITSTAV